MTGLPSLLPALSPCPRRLSRVSHSKLQDVIVRTPLANSPDWLKAAPTRENLLASWRQSGQKQDPCPSLLNHNAKYKRLLPPCCDFANGVRPFLGQLGVCESPRAMTRDTAQRAMPTTESGTVLPQRVPPGPAPPPRVPDPQGSRAPDQRRTAEPVRAPRCHHDPDRLPPWAARRRAVCAPLGSGRFG